MEGHSGASNEQRGHGGVRPSSVRRTLEIYIDAWTFAVLREAFFAVRRFDDFQRNLGVSRSVLTKRLNDLVEQGIFERRLYQHRPDRYEYVLSERGVDMYSIFVAMMRWGDHWLDGGKGPPLLLFHNLCGEQINPVMVCDRCGKEVKARDMSYAPGPGAEATPRAEPQRFAGLNPDADAADGAPAA